jgi:hypothetical protein
MLGSAASEERRDESSLDAADRSVRATSLFVSG